MVYQAVAEYWASANEEEYDVNVDVDMPDRADSFRYSFNRENHYTTKSSKVNIHTPKYSKMYYYCINQCLATRGQRTPKQASRHTASPMYEIKIKVENTSLKVIIPLSFCVHCSFLIKYLMTLFFLCGCSYAHVCIF